MIRDLVAVGLNLYSAAHTTVQRCGLLEGLSEGESKQAVQGAVAD